MALPLVRSRVAGSRVLLEWEWTPDFFAGEFALELSHRGVRIWPAASDAGAVTVRTPAYKLTAERRGGSAVVHGESEAAFRQSETRMSHAR